MDNFISKQASRNYNLDLIKILACIAVVGLHTLNKEISVVSQSLYYVCGFAVPAFFMATGYVLLNRDGVSKNYSWKKINNVLKVVLLWSLLIFIAYMSVKVIKNELVLQVFIVFPKTFLGGFIQRGYLWQFWYLGALIIIYAIYPFLMRNRQRMTLIWILLASIGVLIQITSYVAGTPVQRYIIQTFRLWTWIQYFMLGGLIGSRDNKGNPKAEKKVILGIILTILIVVYQNTMGKNFLHNSYAEYFYDSILTIIWLVSIFDLLLNVKLSPKARRVIQNIAPLTMGIYITHPLVMRVIQHFVTIASLGMSLLFFVVVLIISAICVHFMSKIPYVKKLVEL